MDMKRLKKQMDFILEIDKEKNIKRQTLITDASRQETDAEPRLASGCDVCPSLRVFQ